MAFNDKWVHEGGRTIRVDRFRKQKGWGGAAVAVVLGLLVRGALSDSGNSRQASRPATQFPAVQR